MKLRIFVAAPRSGSTLFMRVMAKHPELAVTSRNVIMGNMKPRDAIDGKRDFKPDYSIFKQNDHPVKKQALTKEFNMVVSKEEYGNDRHTGTPELNECNFDVFPDDDSIIEARLE